jgi:2-C-methyl-D-erythritol 4-phosphate cytidylyltransferase
VTRVAVVIPAGGAGQRMGGVFKPLLELSGEPLLARSMRPFLERDDVGWVIVALPAALAAEPPAWLTDDPRVRIVAGGAERGDSVRNALAAVPSEADVVVVHDAARPLVTANIIERCIRVAAAGGSAVAAVPVVDTIQEVDSGGRIIGTPDRSRLRAAQTPQAFPADLLRRAYDSALRDGYRATDDAALVTRMGETVTVVDGDVDNLKVTTRADLIRAETLLARGAQ